MVLNESDTQGVGEPSTLKLEKCRAPTSMTINQSLWTNPLSLSTLLWGHCLFLKRERVKLNERKWISWGEGGYCLTLTRASFKHSQFFSEMANETISEAIKPQIKGHRWLTYHTWQSDTSKVAIWWKKQWHSTPLLCRTFDLVIFVAASRSNAPREE